jgi:hypothetical protein
MHDQLDHRAETLDIVTAFKNCAKFNGIVGDWDLSSVKSMNISLMFLSIWWADERTDVFIWDERELSDG